MDKNSARMVRTGVCINKEELKELVLEVQTTPDSVAHVINWKVDSSTAGIILLVRSKSGGDKHARQGEVLAHVYVCSLPKEGVFDARDRVGYTKERNGAVWKHWYEVS